MTADIASANLAQWSLIATAMGDAFEHDPVFSWIIRSARRRPAALRRYFAIEARDIALRHGLSTVASAKDPTDVVGAALVLPPGQWRMPNGLLLRRSGQYQGIFGLGVPRALTVISTMERRHSANMPEPHVYLGYIGVMQAHQGRGTGAALIEPVAAHCDEQRLPAYLEASNPENARLYRRLGFETVETITPGGSPPLELMRREPH